MIRPNLIAISFLSKVQVIPKRNFVPTHWIETRSGSRKLNKIMQTLNYSFSEWKTKLNKSNFKSKFWIFLGNFFYSQISFQTKISNWNFHSFHLWIELLGNLIPRVNNSFSWFEEFFNQNSIKFKTFLGSKQKIFSIFSSFFYFSKFFLFSRNNFHYRTCFGALEKFLRDWMRSPTLYFPRSRWTFRRRRPKKFSETFLGVKKNSNSNFFVKNFWFFFSVAWSLW